MNKDYTLFEYTGPLPEKISGNGGSTGNVHAGAMMVRERQKSPWLKWLPLSLAGFALGTILAAIAISGKKRSIRE